MQWLTVKGRARGPGRFSIAVSVLLLIMPLQLAYCRINMPLHELSIQIYHWKDGEPNTETATIKLMRARGIMEEGVEENATEFVPLVGPIKNVPRGKRQTGRQGKPFMHRLPQEEYYNSRLNRRLITNLGVKRAGVIFRIS